MVQVTLIVAEWCPVCPIAKSFWRRLREQYDFVYSEVDISSSEGEALVEKHGIQSVPTTIIDDTVAFVGVPDREKAIRRVRD